MLVIKPARSTSVACVRSSPFTGHSIASHVRTLAPKQYRALSTMSRRKSSIPKSITACLLTPVRSRSSWTNKTPRTSSAGTLRFASSLHRSDCKWVHASGDPKNTSRDRSCPQCLKEDQMPEELSKRELMWQKNMVFWKDFLDNEPYEAIFGRSNAMLKGQNWKEHLDRNMERINRHVTDLLADGMKQADKSSSEIKTPPITKMEAEKSEILKTNAAKPKSRKQELLTEDIPVKKSAGTSTIPASELQGYARWSIRSTDEQGHTKESLAEYVFDPISMKMVPGEIKEVQANKSLPAGQTQDTGFSDDYSYPSKSSSDAPKPDNGFSNDASYSPKSTATGQKSEAGFVEDYSYPPKTMRSSQKQDTDFVEDYSCPPKLVPAAQKQEAGFVDNYMFPPISVSTPENQDAGFVEDYSCPPKAEHTTQKSDNGFVEDYSYPPKAVPAGESQGTGFSEDYSYPWANEKNFNHVEVVDNLEHELAMTKQALETSWRQESRGTVQSTTSMKPADKDMTLGKLIARLPQSNFRNDRKYKEMSTHELSMHRKALMDQWAKRDANVNGEVTPLSVDKKLHDDIEHWKQSMSAFEGKLHRKSTAAADTSSSQDQAQATGPVAGEGDLCPKASSYTHADRWYKQKAPYARMDEEQRLHDLSLVKSILQIYEEAYGPIDVSHRQGKLSSSLEKYEEKLDKAPYAYKQSTEPDTVNIDLKRYEAKLGSKPYAFPPDFAVAAQLHPYISGETPDKPRDHISSVIERGNMLLAHTEKLIPLFSAKVTGSRQALLQKQVQTLNQQLEAQVEAERQYYASKSLLPTENVAEAVNNTSNHPASKTPLPTPTSNSRPMSVSMPTTAAAIGPAAAASAAPVAAMTNPSAAESVSIAASSAPSPLTPALDRIVKKEGMREKAASKEIAATDQLRNPIDPSLTKRPQSSMSNYLSPTGFYRDPDTDYVPPKTTDSTPQAEDSVPRAINSTLKAVNSILKAANSNLRVAKSNSTHSKSSSDQKASLVRKEEAVFSGSKGDNGGWGSGIEGARRYRRFYHERTNQRGVFQQTLLSATIIGAFCYITGVTIELFREVSEHRTSSSPGDGKGSNVTTQKGPIFPRTKEDQKVTELTAGTATVMVLGTLARAIVLGGITYAIWSMLGGSGR